MKTYRIYFVFKINGNKYLHYSIVSGVNQKDAMDKFNSHATDNLNRHPFYIKFNQHHLIREIGIPNMVEYDEWHKCFDNTNQPLFVIK